MTIKPQPSRVVLLFFSPSFLVRAAVLGGLIFGQNLTKIKKK